MCSILNRALSWAITSFGNEFCLKKRSRLIKVLHNRFYVKFMQLEIGLLLGRALEQFINRQIAILNWFTGGRTVMLNKDGEESAAYKKPITCLNTMYKLCTKIIGTFLINHNMKYD